ncbi:MAG: hypothetical protein ACREMY_02560 [bacterium]
MIIESLNAVAANPSGRPITLPPNLDARALVGLLSQLGLMIPTSVSASVAANNLRASGHRFTNKETDAALAAANLSITDRIKLKTAMGANGILER